ncbi:MAG: hypothetical protein VX555_02975 [Pseudomonadota bacterium]|nr:hypothetical protein [Pseudomonadota bacterium]
MTQFAKSSQEHKRHHAGAVEPFPSGRITYLAPKPLPTGFPPVDYGHAVGAVTQHYLDFGVGNSSAFAWQMTIFGPFGLFLLSAVIGPLIMFWGGYHFGNGWEDAVWGFNWAFAPGFWVGLAALLGGLFLAMLPRWQMYSRAEKIAPTRFHRQRREVCFVPEGYSDPIFIPWEDLEAWVIESQGATEYGVHRQCGFGIGFRHPETGERFNLEFPTSGLPLSISTWEALRAYMEYEVHTLEEIQPHGELMTGDDAPKEEGVAFFHAARRNVRRRRKAGEVGWIYTLFWYLYHIVTFWTLPNRLVEWENRKLQGLLNRSLPPTMEAWSQTLPQDQWAEPSDELRLLSQRVREEISVNPGRPITEIYSDIYAEDSAARRKRA